MKLIGIILFMVFAGAFSVLAGEPAVDPIAVIEQGKDLYGQIAGKQAGIAGGVGGVLYFFTNLLKMKTDAEGRTLLDKVCPKRWRPLAIAAVGALGGFAATLATGGTLPIALGTMLASGAIPTLLHEIVSVTVKNEEKKVDG
jgi:hypothetical protein